MNLLNKFCEEKNFNRYNSVIIKRQNDCSSYPQIKNYSLLNNYLLKVGAASAISFSLCSIEHNSSNFHYSESILVQETNKLGIKNILINSPIDLNEDIDSEHEIAYKTTELENLNPIFPKRTIKVNGNIVKINKGLISKV